MRWGFVVAFVAVSGLSWRYFFPIPLLSHLPLPCAWLSQLGAVAVRVRRVPTLTRTNYRMKRSALGATGILATTTSSLALQLMRGR